ncbi:MAG: AIR synthase-related protein [Cyclobacteriaceae bacterium]
MIDFPEVGKIQDSFLKSHVFSASGAVRGEVFKGPKYGVDTSVVNITESLSLITATDPASLIPTLGLKESAWLTVHLVASDIATAGSMPQYAQFCLNLPEYITAAQFNEYWGWVSAFCKELGVAITGGHTGKVQGQNSTVSGGVTMFSCVETNTVLTSDMAKPGDELILVKEPAIISTAILALSFPETIANACGEDVLKKGQELFYQSSAVQAAKDAVSLGIHEDGVRAMHDVTECGVIGATKEMMMAAACGVEIYEDRLVRGDVQQMIGDLFGYDPLYTVGAGALLMSVNAKHSGRIAQSLGEKGYPVQIIGKVKEQEHGMVLMGKEKKQLKHPGTDPYWNVFFDSLKKGLK